MTIEPKLNDRLMINVNGESKEIFMSGGLIRQLMPIAGELADFAMVFADVVTQNALIVECLRPRTLHGTATKDVKFYTIEDFQMSLEDTEALVEWIMEHVLHFFVKSLTSAKNLVERNQEAMETIVKLTQSTTGLGDSPPQTQSVGLSIAAQAK